MTLEALKKALWVAAGEAVYWYYRRKRRKQLEKEAQARARKNSIRTKVPNTVGDKNGKDKAKPVGR